MLAYSSSSQTLTYIPKCSGMKYVFEVNIFQSMRYHCNVDNLIQLIFLLEHLCLSGMWFGAYQKIKNKHTYTHTKNMCVYKLKIKK